MKFDEIAVFYPVVCNYLFKFISVGAKTTPTSIEVPLVSLDLGLEKVFAQSQANIYLFKVNNRNTRK